jgi:hypothetical protein
MKRKPGPKPKGGRPLTATEKTQRYRARLKIIAEELDRVGAQPVTVFMPPVYAEALRMLEANLQAQPNLVDVMVYSSSWLCRIVEQFIEQEVGLFPDSELARLYHSERWTPKHSIDFLMASARAKQRIYELNQQYEKELRDDTHSHQ